METRHWPRIGEFIRREVSALAPFRVESAPGKCVGRESIDTLPRSTGSEPALAGMGCPHDCVDGAQASRPEMPAQAAARLAMRCRKAEGPKYLVPRPVDGLVPPSAQAANKFPKPRLENEPESHRRRIKHTDDTWQLSRVVAWCRWPRSNFQLPELGTCFAPPSQQS
ncbi:hypothetical protein BR93DRAFT_33471 [Coniochaeta sp. PMI_546]|nr:hypothetical protein BR93DRAFT_33471 [Coniochaeta sp. PMI_546]